MGTAVTMEELARIAGVRAATVRKAVRELLELLETEASEGRLTLADLDVTGVPAAEHDENELLGLRGRRLILESHATGMVNRGFVASARIVIGAPATKVWGALVNPDVIKEYMFGAKVVSDWKEGSAIVWKGVWKGKPYEDKGTILELDEGKRVSYSHFSPLTGEQDVPENYHTVTIELEGGGEQTTVTLTQDNNPNEEAREHSQKNWEALLQGMKRLLES